MNPEELKDRTKKFALRVIKAVQILPNSDECRVFKRQLVKAGTAPKPISFQKLQLLKRKQTKLLFG